MLRLVDNGDAVQHVLAVDPAAQDATLALALEREDMADEVRAMARRLLAEG